MDLSIGPTVLDLSYRTMVFLSLNMISDWSISRWNHLSSLYSRSFTGSMGPICCRWNFRVFTWLTRRSQLFSPESHRTVYGQSSTMYQRMNLVSVNCQDVDVFILSVYIVRGLLTQGCLLGCCMHKCLVGGEQEDPRSARLMILKRI